jgi:hypothetical protein
MTEITSTATGWAAYHRRAAALNDVIAHLDRTEATTPDWSGDLAGVFADREDLLVALHDRWTRRLEGRIDMAAELDLEPAPVAVAKAWRQVATELPGVRRVLDAQAQHPALRKHELHEHRLVAIAAELAAMVDPVEWAAAQGSRFVTELRRVPTPRPGGFGERIIAAVRSIA